MALFKVKANNFNANFVKINVFKSFKYNAKLLEETNTHPISNNNNGILKNVSLAVPLKYLSKFWR